MKFPRIFTIYRDKLKNLWAKAPIIDDTTISSGTHEYTFSIDRVESKNISIDAIKQIILTSPWSTVTKPPYVAFESADAYSRVTVRFMVLGEAKGKLIEEDIKKHLKTNVTK